MTDNMFGYQLNFVDAAQEKVYEIEEDCMFDKEHETWVPTIYKCGRCHSKVEKTNTMCWHCRAKLKRRT